MKAYYHDNQDDIDQREAHFGGQELTTDQLKEIGVLYYRCNDIDSVNKIAEERNYVSRDIIQVTPEKLGGPEAYAEKLRNFYTEHLHEDEEIRYILEGEGYFDVREKNDRWVRCSLEVGDLLILPAGIYHRFTLTSKNFVKTMRLFKEMPRWVAINRPVADDNPYRSEYLTSIVAN